jgi:hypothetical protein
MDRKDSEIGTYVTYALVNKNHLDCIHWTKKAALLKGISMPKAHTKKRGRSTAYCSRKHPTLWSSSMPIYWILFVFRLHRSHEIKKEMRKCSYIFLVLFLDVVSCHTSPSKNVMVIKGKQYDITRTLIEVCLLSEFVSELECLLCCLSRNWGVKFI